MGLPRNGLAYTNPLLRFKVGAGRLHLDCPPFGIAFPLQPRLENLDEKGEFMIRFARSRVRGMETVSERFQRAWRLADVTGGEGDAVLACLENRFNVAGAELAQRDPRRVGGSRKRIVTASG